MDRRCFLKTMGLGVASFAAYNYSKIYSASAVSSRKLPNVILVITDDQGYGDLACHGNPVLETPNLDKLYSQSIRLTNFHVGPTCSPTRASLMTGRYCNRTGVWHTIMGRSLLRKDEVTMADIFRAGGYRTAIFGKWHLGDNYPYRAHDRGFQEAIVHGGGGIGNSQDYWGNDYFDDTYFRNGRPEKFEGYCTDVWFAEAIKFIEANKKQPFFCYLSTNAPHGPWYVPEKYIKHYKNKGLDEPASRFYGMVTNIDENMGRLMEKLEALDLVDNTILIFMTDNGTSLPKNRGGFGAGMRGNKGSEYDGGHRVPFFIRWPKSNLKAPEDVDRLAAHIDVLPTLIELCGLKKPADIKFDGKSIVSLLTFDARHWPDRVIITDSQRIDHPVKWRKSAVMTDRWRLINGKELYDIRTDRDQKNNVFEKHPEIVAELLKAYEKWWSDVSQRFDEYCEIIVGSEYENPTCLTSHDIHGKVAWNQWHVRNADPADGFWAIEVAQKGAYEISLRRWPRESNRPIALKKDSLLLEKNEKPMFVTDARLKVANIDIIKPIEPDAAEVKFKVNLDAGKSRLQAWFIDGFDDGHVCGAYYVYVNRLS